jgi:hypothetical protein
LREKALQFLGEHAVFADQGETSQLEAEVSGNEGNAGEATLEAGGGSPEEETSPEE